MIELILIKTSLKVVKSLESLEHGAIRIKKPSESILKEKNPFWTNSRLGALNQSFLVQYQTVFLVLSHNGTKDSDKAWAKKCSAKRQ